MNASEIIRNMAEAAAQTIIEKMTAKGMTTEQAEQYVRTHEAEVADFAIRLIASYHLNK